jgi:hypothetical protein
MPAMQPMIVPAMAPVALAFLHNRRKATGITADPMITPMARYIHPKETPTLLRITAKTPMKHPNASTIILDTLRICCPVAFGLMYVRYMSYVQSEDTATSSAEPADVTALTATRTSNQPSAKERKKQRDFNVTQNTKYKQSDVYSVIQSTKNEQVIIYMEKLPKTAEQNYRLHFNAY